MFQRSLFRRITTLLTWLKSTLLLKNKYFDTTIYMKTQWLQTNETQHNWKGKCLRSDRWSRERVAIIKSLIYARWKRDVLEARLPNWAENVSWYRGHPHKNYTLCHCSDFLSNCFKELALWNELKRKFRNKIFFFSSMTFLNSKNHSNQTFLKQKTSLDTLVALNQSCIEERK